MCRQRTGADEERYRGLLVRLSPRRWGESRQILFSVKKYDSHRREREGMKGDDWLIPRDDRLIPMKGGFRVTTMNSHVLIA